MQTINGIKVVAIRSYDYNGNLLKTADGRIWYASDVGEPYEVSPLLWK